MHSSTHIVRVDFPIFQWEKLDRNYSVAWTKIKTIKIYLTTTQINVGGKKIMEKTHSPPEKLTKNLALPKHVALICPEGKHQAFREAFYPLLELQVAHCVSISSQAPDCPHPHHSLSKNSALHTKPSAKVDITDVLKGTCSQGTSLISALIEQRQRSAPTLYLCT